MLKSLLVFALTRRTIVILGLLVFLGGGLIAFTKLNIEAYPNPAPVILEITAQQAGLSAEEMERYYTVPMEIGLYSTPGIANIRSTSFYGLTFIRVTFKYGVDYYFAYTQAALSLQQNVTLPQNQIPQIQQSSLVGEVYRYQVVGPPHFGLTNLRTVQDWIVLRRLSTIPGVAQINSWGGTTKEFEVEADLGRLQAYGITMPQLLTTLGNANINVGGREINIGQQSVNIRGIGLVDDGGNDDLTKGYHVEDIENVVLTQTDGVPVRVKDVAKVYVGYVPRLGIAGRDHQDDIVAADRRHGAHLSHQRDRAADPGGDRPDEQRREPAAGGQDRPLLRPDVAGRGDHSHGSAQSHLRLRARLPDPMDLPGRSAQRDHRRAEHSLRAAVRDHPAGAARRGCEPVVHRRRGFRHHRRFRGDPGRECLS